MHAPNQNGAARKPVLLVAYLYPPHNYSGAIRAYRFVKYLERLGHPATVLAAGTSSRPAVEGGVHRVRGELEHYPQRDISACLERIARRVLFPYDAGSIWGARAIGYSRRLMGARPRPVVLSTSPPVTAHWVGLWLKKRYGARWIADFRDPFMDSAGRTKWVAARTDPLIERAIFRAADAIVANTDVAAEKWRRRYPELGRKIHVIWNGFDPEEPLGPSPLPPRDYRIISHVGEIYSTRHPGHLLASLDRLLRRNAAPADRLRVRLVGTLERSSFPDPGLLDRLAAAGFVEYTPRQVPRREAQEVMAGSDYLLLLDLLRGNTGLHVPAKLFEYVRIGRPILAITTRNSAAERVLGWSGVPFVCIYGDDGDSEVDRKVLEFLRLPGDPVPCSEYFTNTFGAVPQAAYLSRLIEGAATPAECR